MRHLLLATALFVTACVDAGPDGSPGPDAAVELDAVAGEADAMVPDAALSLVCSDCPDDLHVCDAGNCHCTALTLPGPFPCLGTCAEACPAGEYLVDEIGYYCLASPARIECTL